jgi:cytochrome c oxidase subunit II
MHISPVLWQFLVHWLTNSALFPPEASAISPYMDAFYFFLLAISAVGLIAVGILVFGFSLMYRKEKNPVATHIEGSTLLEATWTIIPLALFMVCFVWGALLYYRIYDPPTNAMNIYIVGKQWMWKAEHPGGQHEINSLHVPINRQVQLTMISQDVFHSFSIPAFRVKREVIPGRYSTVWFEATATGTYHLFCTQYCGTDHSAMIGEIVAMTPDAYQAWAAGSTSGASLAQNGERLFASLGCNSCHSGLSSRVDSQPLYASDCGLCADHADLSGAGQRGGFDRPSGIHQEPQLELSRSTDVDHESALTRASRRIQFWLGLARNELPRPADAGRRPWRP